MRGCFVSLVLAMLAAHADARASHDSLSISEAKAAYLYNFARMAEFPAQAASPSASSFVLCVFGRDAAIAHALEGLAGKLVGGRPMQVRAAVDPATVHDCRIAYVAGGDAGLLNELRRAAGSAPVLLVGEGGEFLVRGGAVELRPLDRRLGFAVNLEATRRAGIRLPAPLLRLAAEVRE